MENMGYGQQERLKDIVEKEAEEEQPAATKEEGQGPAAVAKEQQQDDDEHYDLVTKIKLEFEGRVKEWWQEI